MQHPILESLPADQQALVDIIVGPWLRTGRWPVFDYTRRRLLAETGVHAVEILHLLPVIKQRMGHGMYYLTFSEDGGPFADRNKRLGLTVAGLFHHRTGREIATNIVAGISWLAEADAALVPDPDQPVDLEVSLEHLIASCPHLETWKPDDLGRALSNEPPLWGAVRPGSDGAVAIFADERLGNFRHVRDVEDYLRRSIRFLGAQEPQSVAPEVRSPLDLPEALGYLDVVWRLRYDSSLIAHSKPSAAARLCLPCASGDEFDSRLSALADVLGQLTIRMPESAEQEAKKQNERSLARMKRRIALDQDLSDEARMRVDEAIDLLRRAVRIRVSGQHSGLGGEIAESFAGFGIRYPPRDLGDAWEQIRSQCASAVDAIRQELEVEEVPA